MGCISDFIQEEILLRKMRVKMIKKYKKKGNEFAKSGMKSRDLIINNENASKSFLHILNLINSYTFYVVRYRLQHFQYLLLRQRNKQNETKNLMMIKTKRTRSNHIQQK